MMENGINAVNCDKLRNGSEHCGNLRNIAEGCDNLRSDAEHCENCDNLQNLAEKIRKIATHYGEMNQVIKTSEELAELNQVLMKYLIKGNRMPDIRRNIVGEIADVTIMIGQLCYLWKIDHAELNQVIEIKLDRQMERIRNGEQ